MIQIQHLVRLEHKIVQSQVIKLTYTKSRHSAVIKRLRLYEILYSIVRVFIIFC